MKKPNPIILLVGLTALAMGVSLLLSRVTAIIEFDDPLLSHVARLFPPQVVYLIIAVTALVIAKDKRPPSGSTNRWLPIGWIAAGFVVGTLSAVLSGDTGAFEFQQSSTFAQWGLAIWAIGTTPACEELFFRKMFLDLYPEDQTACWLSVLLFIIVHNRLDIGLVLAAVTFLFAYRTTGKLWVAIATHATVNACEFVSLTGVQP